MKSWSETLRTPIGLFVEVAEGNRFAGAGGNRYSFLYSGDVNGDGQGGNDLIYIPANQGEILFVDCPTGCGANVTADAAVGRAQRVHRAGQVPEHPPRPDRRAVGAVNPWYNNVDLRILQDFGFGGVTRHNFQLSLDVLNVGNLISSDWGVRKVASSAATSPLRLVGFDGAGAPVFNFTGPAETFIDDPSVFSPLAGAAGVEVLLRIVEEPVCHPERSEGDHARMVPFAVLRVTPGRPLERQPEQHRQPPVLQLHRPSTTDRSPFV